MTTDVPVSRRVLSVLSTTHARLSMCFCSASSASIWFNTYWLGSWQTATRKSHAKCSLQLQLCPNWSVWKSSSTLTGKQSDLLVCLSLVNLRLRFDCWEKNTIILPFFFKCFFDTNYSCLNKEIFSIFYYLFIYFRLKFFDYCCLYFLIYKLVLSHNYIKIYNSDNLCCRFFLH